MEKEKVMAFMISALTFLVFVFIICQGLVMAMMSQFADDSQKYTNYWQNKTDSLSEENFNLHMQIYDLQDSIITLRFER